MCGSSEGPTPEQLAHPPLSSPYRPLLRLLMEAERASRENAAILFALGARPSDRFLTWPVKDGRHSPKFP
jgi:hypothetical protein